MIEGAPGHGEGHNSGVPLNIIAALAVKKVMEREHLTGTITAVAGSGRGAGRRPRRTTCAPACSRTWTSCLFAHVAANLGRVVGPATNHERTGSVEYHVQGRERACRGRALARQERAGRGRTDGHRLEFPPRASAAGAALALRDHQRRRPAERRAADRHRLVLLPRGGLRAHHGHVAHRRQHGQGRDA